PELYKLCQSVFGMAVEKRASFKTVGVLLIHEDLDQKSKSRTLKTHSNNFEILHSTARSILEEAMEETDKKVRRLGVRLSDLQSTTGQDTMSQFMGG
ncbi:MAG: DNA polymerase IV, partial [Nitrososphaera sp.]